MRLTEEEYREIMRRRALPCAPARESGVTLAGWDGGEEKKGKKYGNVRCEVDGKKFDSRHEARVYEELMLRWMAKEVRVVMRQAPFDLPGGIRYIADFAVIEADGRFRVLDAKSEATRKNRVYINKKKQMKAVWGIEIEEV